VKMAHTVEGLTSIFLDLHLLTFLLITMVNKIYFFVPRTSIDELSSYFYAKFRYVYRIFLSSKVSKI